MGIVIADDDTLKPAGIDTIIHIEDGNLAVERRQECQPILDQVKAIKDVTNGISESRDLYHVARIPSGIIEKYCNERGVTFHEFCVDDAHVTRIMNDAEYAHLRIWEGAA